MPSIDQSLSRLVLASASPRRRDILKIAGYVFEVADPGDVEETINTAESPARLAIEKARVKAHAVARSLAAPFPALVLGADTLVAAHGRIVGKPMDRNDALAILASLSGTRHAVISGVCAIRAEAGGALSTVCEFAETTWVKMRAMSAAEIAAYVESGQSDGKAGAYAIQENGDRFVEAIEGSFLNVVGFPLERFAEEIRKSMSTA